jgi:hypothetical protein
LKDNDKPVGVPIFEGVNHLSSQERAEHFRDTYHVMRNRIAQPTHKAIIAGVATASLLGLGAAVWGLKMLLPTKK